MHNHQAFIAVIIVAAGSGSRAGQGEAKQFRLLAGKPVLRWSIDAALASPGVGSVVVVCPPGEVDRARELAPKDSRMTFTEGGATRTASVRNGLAAAPHAERVLIHDAARPGLTPDVVEDLLAALDSADAAAPALAMTDAVKHVGGPMRSVDRTDLVRVQTPQAFRAELLRARLASAPADAVDDLALFEGDPSVRITLTPGRASLMKITHPEDFEVVARLIAPPRLRIGSGYDVHAFGAGDHVTICGVRVPHTHGLEGHSDADVAWHALTDAILGAAALGDIGQHFPPSDPQWKGAASIRFLQHAQQLAAQQGLLIVNADITLICERPKIGPHREAMRASTAAALGLDLSAISIKATTTEKLGFTGRGEGMAAEAVVLLGGA